MCFRDWAGGESCHNAILGLVQIFGHTIPTKTYISVVTTSCVVTGAVVVELAYTGVDVAGEVTTGEELDSDTVDEP